jgi:hypothetical protein
MNAYTNTPLCGPGNTNGCAVATGFEEFSTNNYQLKLYPNPANAVLNVELEEELNPSTSLRVTDYKLKIVNIIGLEVQTTNNFKQSTQLNIGHLQNGIYFLQVLQDNKVVATKKIIKE